MDDEIRIERDDGLLTVTFDRPDKHNALTWTMYDALGEACEEANSSRVAAMVFRSSSRRAFAAGTDIRQFAEFRRATDGVEYERRVSDVVEAILSVRVPTVASVGGYCVGAGFLVACACDLRIATEDARFGAPIARTLGNCLSQSSYRLVVELLGRGTALDLLLRARLMTAGEALARGLVVAVTTWDELGAVTAAEIARLRGHAPLSLLATKTSLNRLLTAPDQDNDDILELVYGSRDFRDAVQRFHTSDTPRWSGQ